MPGLIPEEIINQIQDRADIVEIISSYIPLKRAGRNFRTLCPFHHEKTPSFMVSPDRQIYHCFGCGEGGNVFRFLMRYERLEFLEAVRLLAKRTGINLPEAETGVSAAQKNLSTQIYQANELAAEFYHQNLLKDKEAQIARNYLVKRGIRESTVKKFKLGFAANNWDGLINYLRAKNISLNVMEKAGLVIAKGEGGYYDRFRARIIFPIFDVRNRILGLGARVWDESLPKYMNSPESAVYVKGDNLYGLNFTKDAIRQKDEVIVVEGYLDFITPYESGILNIVASLGTALTENQIRLLKRYTQNVVMVYDSDESGQLAVLRSLDLFIEQEMNVRVVSIDVGFDPDSFIRSKGHDAFTEKVESSLTLFDYKLDFLKNKFGFKSIEAKANIVKEMLPTLSRFNNAVLKSSYIRMLSEKLSIAEEAILQEMKKEKVPKEYAALNRHPQGAALNLGSLEKMILKLMLKEADLVSKVKETLDIADFQDTVVCEIIKVLFDLCSKGQPIDASKLMNSLADEKQINFICELVASEAEPEVVDKERVLNDCIERLKHQRLKSTCLSLHEEIKKAQTIGDHKRAFELAHKFNALVKRKSNEDATYGTK